MKNPREVQSVRKRDGKRFVVRADEKLSALVGLERAIRGRVFST